MLSAPADATRPAGYVRLDRSGRRSWLLHQVRGHCAAVFVEIECAPQSRERPLRTVVTFADAAARADGCGCEIWVPRQVESFRVGEPVSLAKFAAQPNREGFTRLTIPGGAALHGAGNPHVIAAIGHLGDLHEDLARVGERLVDIPQGAGSATGGEMKTGGRLAF